MSEASIICPRHYLVVKRNERGWVFKPASSVLYNVGNVPLALGLDPLLEEFRTTQKEIVYALFRLHAGRFGYYLANLRHRRYYYCGLEWQDVKTMLLELGIGQVDPLEGEC